MWSTDVPPTDGWYWVRYQDRKQNQVTCPAFLRFFIIFPGTDRECRIGHLRSFDNEEWTSEDGAPFGGVLIGPRIEMPD
jgi:hypothetical protein